MYRPYFYGFLSIMVASVQLGCWTRKHLNPSTETTSVYCIVVIISSELQVYIHYVRHIRDWLRSFIHDSCIDNLRNIIEFYFWYRKPFIPCFSMFPILSITALWYSVYPIILNIFRFFHSRSLQTIACSPCVAYRFNMIRDTWITSWTTSLIWRSARE